MVCTRRQDEAAATRAVLPKTESRHADPSPALLSTPPANHEAYERSREERIRANLEKMQKLGIIDIGLKLKAENRKSSFKREFKSPQLVLKSAQQPSRRSSRLRGLPSVCYSESRKGINVVQDLVLDVHVKREDGDWNIDTSGQSVRGRVIYDKINGKTCHQCRQKTLRVHSHCSKCEGVRGQFCGGCLRARYGEQILEVLQNPSWVCPVCRGICNCSFCRLKHGLVPTGQIFHKVSKVGFQSVAHYLSQSKLSQPVTDVSGEANSISTKRVLIFAEN